MTVFLSDKEIMSVFASTTIYSKFDSKRLKNNVFSFRRDQSFNAHRRFSSAFTIGHLGLPTVCSSLVCYIGTVLFRQIWRPRQDSNLQPAP